MQKYELKLLWTVFRNFLQRVPVRHPVVEDGFRYCEDLIAHGKRADVWLKGKDVWEKSPEWVPSELLGDGHRPVRWAELAELERRALGHVKPSAVRRRLETMGQLLDIDEVGVSILEILVLKQFSSAASSLFDLIERVSARPTMAFSIASGHSQAAIERRLAPSGELRQLGLLDHSRFVKMDPFPDLSPSTAALLSQPWKSAADARHILLGKPLGASLDWADFDHLGDGRQFVCDLLAGALRQGQRGVNVLLHGPPGTGKTEFVRTLAVQLGTELYALGEEDECGGEPAAYERIGSIQMAQRLLRDHGDAVLLIDEAEDVLGGSFSSSAPFGFGPVVRRSDTVRVFLHRLLEGGAAPMVWICNSISAMDEAALRRFSYVLEIQPPPRRSRQRVWMRSLEQHGYTGCEQLAARCAELPVSPGIAAQAVRSARIAGRGAEAVEQVARDLGRGVVGKPLPKCRDKSTDFCLELVRADQDLEALTERLAAMPEPRFSLCVDGPPGSGKSAWVRHLAERMDMEVRLRRASDLLNMYVGGTEARIARAFSQAQAAGEMLVFDEADSFLRDRRGAQRSWEVTGVNEMLTWMESHPLPFACTTNLIEAMDAAAMRRFSFKLRFDYLDARRVRLAFRRFFSADWPASVAMPGCLTPGDFAVVEQRARIQGVDAPKRLAEWLLEECRYKPGRSRGMGFLQAAG